MKRIGNLVGMSIVQGGSGFPFFAPSMNDDICGTNVCNIAPTVEVPDTEVKAVLIEGCVD